MSIDCFRLGDDCGDQCLTIKTDTGDKGASPSCSWDTNMERAAGRDLMWPHKDFDVLSVGEHLNTHFVHVEDEAWVDAVELGGDVVVELLDFVELDIDSGSFTGYCVRVNSLFKGGASSGCWSSRGSSARR